MLSFQTSDLPDWDEIVVMSNRLTLAFSGVQILLLEDFMFGKETFTILLVDDSPEDLETYQRYLRQDRHHVYSIRSAQSAAQALKLCQTQSPDLILLDFLLPDLDGIQFIDALRQQTSGLTLPAIVVLTGQGNEEVAVALMKKGVQDYLIKSKLTATGLQSTIRQTLTNIELQQSLALQQQTQRILADVSLRIQRSLDLTNILDTAVTEVKRFLICDRVVVYRIEPHGAIKVIAEAVAPPWGSALGAQVPGAILQASIIERYRQNQPRVIPDITEIELSGSLLSLYQELEVRSLVGLPILLPPATPDELPQLWGVLVAHQCQQPRVWTDAAVAFLDQLSVQLAIAIQQAELVTRLNQELAYRAENERNLSRQTQEQAWSIGELDKTTSLLRERNQELDSFVLLASHDLRAPLRSIANLTTWLVEDLEDVVDATFQPQFKLLRARVEQMDSLLKNLLQYARTGRVDAKVESVSVAQMLVDVIDGLDVPPEFTIYLAPDLPQLSTNRTALEQVLSNLIRNAIEHHDRSNGRVEVSACRAGDCYRFQVTDDGAGIDPRLHTEIFKLFRTDSNVTNCNGTGIGLAIVKKIVELQGGTVGIESNIGTGTTFWFTWPIGVDVTVARMGQSHESSPAVGESADVRSFARQLDDERSHSIRPGRSGDLSRSTDAVPG
jgi:signal transduction histidine kinase